MNLLQNKNLIFIILAVHFLLRVLVASFTTLGNDEVYYTLYAKYLDYSYFDHPPMVGWFIWLSTFGNIIHSDFFVRLSPIIVGTVNIYLIFILGKKLRNITTGNIAALLSAGSLYISIISGLFILPDTPQSLFWLLSIYFFFKILETDQKKYLIFFGIAVGLALLSKYHAIYLWFGAGLYILLYNRSIMKTPYLYLAVLISLFIFSPVIYWNIFSSYSGIGYHESRLGSGSILPNFKFFFPEFFGQIFYNNPFNFFIIVASLIILAQKKVQLNPKISFLLCISIPLAITTLIMAMYNRTLPHWSGPAYFGFILIAAYVFSDKRYFTSKKLLISVKGSVALILVIIFAGLFQIKTGLLFGNPNLEAEKLGKDNFTLDISIWENAGNELKKHIPKNSIIVTHNWFPASHFTYYFGDENNVKVYVIGDSDKKHQFLKINKDLGEISTQDNVYYLTTSHYYEKPTELFLNKFDTISRKTVTINQHDKKMLNIFIWKSKAKTPVIP